MARFNQPTLLSLLGLFLGLLSQSNAAPAPRVARDVDVESESYQRHRPPGFHHGYPPFPPTLKVREESAEGSGLFPTASYSLSLRFPSFFLQMEGNTDEDISEISS